MTHHSPLTVLANIPAPSCGIGSTSTRRELRTSSENAPRCVDENADTANVKSPSEFPYRKRKQSKQSQQAANNARGRSAENRAKPYVYAPDVAMISLCTRLSIGASVRIQQISQRQGVGVSYSKTRSPRPQMAVALTGTSRGACNATSIRIVADGPCCVVDGGTRRRYCGFSM